MVENGRLYFYTGTIIDTRAIPWSWAQYGLVPTEQNGYTYSWLVPVGMSTWDTISFVIQTQGYGPAADAFTPCPDLSDSPTGGKFCA